MKPYTFPSRPNPAVYRSAAKYIHQGTYGYCCHAIDTAALLDGCNRLESELYAAQFKSVFAFCHGEPPSVLQENREVWGYHHDRELSAANHPFWNKNPTPRRQEIRILALLLMADICENPT